MIVRHFHSFLFQSLLLFKLSSINGQSDDIDSGGDGQGVDDNFDNNSGDDVGGQVSCPVCPSTFSETPQVSSC